MYQNTLFARYAFSISITALAVLLSVNKTSRYPPWRAPRMERTFLDPPPIPTTFLCRRSSRISMDTVRFFRDVLQMDPLISMKFPQMSPTACWSTSS